MLGVKLCFGCPELVFHGGVCFFRLKRSHTNRCCLRAAMLSTLILRHDSSCPDFLNYQIGVGCVAILILVATVDQLRKPAKAA